MPRIFRRQAQLNRGRVLDTSKKVDCIYSLYHSVVLAPLTSTIAIREKIVEFNQGIAVDQRLNFRFGMHSSDVIVEGQGVRGDAINTAARLRQAEAEPGDIVVSDQNAGRSSRHKRTSDSRHFSRAIRRTPP